MLSCMKCGWTTQTHDGIGYSSLAGQDGILCIRCLTKLANKADNARKILDDAKIVDSDGLRKLVERLRETL